MLTTTVAGRTWNFSHAIGRLNETGVGFLYPTSVALGADGVGFVLNRGTDDPSGVVQTSGKRVVKVSIEDQEFIDDFGHDEFVWPCSIAIDKEGNLFCSDEYLNVIIVFDSNGNRIGRWGNSGSGVGQLNGASGLEFDGDDNLYVVDSLNDRVQKFTKDGKFLFSWGSSGNAEGQFKRPWGITVDNNDHVYVADWDNNRVQKFSPDGDFLLNFGASSSGDVALQRPADVAVDSEGDVYITDWGGKLVRIYDSTGNSITSLEGDAYELSKWGKQTVDANPDYAKGYRRAKNLEPFGRFNRPLGVEIDVNDRVIIVDSNRCRLQIYDKEKNYLDPQSNI